MTEMELTQEIVRELLDYDPETGNCFWKYRDIKWFKSTTYGNAIASFKTFNKRRTGKPAGHLDKKTGYKHIEILGKTYQLHHIIFLWMTGYWPDTIDHKNGDRSCNEWQNLKNTSQAENLKNKGFNKNNTSGYKGVGWHKRDKKWFAFITENGRKRFLGNYNCITAAFLAYCKEARKLGFTERHIYGKL